MKQALRQAELAFEKEEVPVGAVIVYKDKIIGKAYNQTKLLKDPTAHAEMIAITQAAAYLENERLNDTILYVTLEPCLMCAGAIVWARIKRVVFGAEDPKTGACGSVLNIFNVKKLNRKVEVISNILSAECGRLMRDFFKGKR